MGVEAEGEVGDARCSACSARGVGAETTTAAETALSEPTSEGNA